MTYLFSVRFESISDRTGLSGRYLPPWLRCGGGMADTVAVSLSFKGFQVLYSLRRGLTEPFML